MFIPDSRSSIPDPGSRVKKIPDPDPHKRIFNPKSNSKLSEILYGDVHPGFGSRYLIFYLSRIQDLGPRGNKGTASRIRNTAVF
jgi:hypothetical protein